MEDLIHRLETIVNESGSIEEVYSFLRFQATGVVTDYVRAYAFLKSDLLDTEKVERITAACRVNQYIVQNRSHSKSVPTPKPYAVYRMLNPDGKITGKQFQMVFPLVSQIELNPQEYELSKDSLRAVEIWKRFGESPEHICEYVCMIGNDLRSALRSSYLYPSAECDFAERQKGFVDAIRLLGKKPLNRVDAVCAAYLGSDCHDVLTENLYAYFAFTSAIDIYNPAAGALVVGASPLFMRRWLRDECLANVDVTFVMDDMNVRDVFQQAYPRRPHVRFRSIEELRANPMQNMAKNIMVFGNHVPDGHHDLISTLKKAASQVHTLFYLGADTQVTAPTSELYQLLCEDDMELIEVNLLPAGIHQSTDPQRKMLIRSEFGYIQKSADDQIRIRFYSLDKANDHQCLCPKPFVAQMNVPNFEQGTQSIRNVYRMAELAQLQKTEGKRQRPETYAFSQEISIYATASMPEGDEERQLRVETYVKIPGKGERIEGSVKRTKKVQLAELADWVTNVYPYETVIRDGNRYSIREIIGAEYRAVYANRPITLKSLLYLYPEIEEHATKVGGERLAELAGSDLGDALVTHMTVPFAHSILDLLYPQPERERDWLQARRVLADVLDVAIAYGHCQNNDIREDMKQDTADYATMQIISRNLRKQSFSVEELQTLYRKIQRKLEQGHSEYLGVLICMLCGLESNVVCAFKWGDFQRVESLSFHGQPVYQLYIRRQLQNDGEAYREFEKPYSFRVIPCHARLTEFLLKERDRQKVEKDYLTDENFALEPIVQGKKMVRTGMVQVMPPRELSSLCRELIRSIGIRDQIIPIPDDGRGVSESNLVNYSADFFRSNYRHYGICSCLYNPGELAYLMGNKGPTTYDRNYCDYANDYSQLVLLVKQNRWISQLIPIAAAESQFIVQDKVSSFHYATQPDPSGSAEVDMMITVPAGTACRVTIKSEYGCSGRVAKIKEVKVDGGI